MHSVEENPATEKITTVDYTPEGLHVYGSGGQDIGITEDETSFGYEYVRVYLNRPTGQLRFRLPSPSGDSMQVGEMTFYLDAENHAIVFRASLPEEGVWKAALELSPEN